jgi:hypothetical protein
MKANRAIFLKAAIALIFEAFYVWARLGLHYAKARVVEMSVNFSFSEDSIEEWQALSSLVADSHFDEDGT